MTRSGEVRLKAAKRVLRYLKGIMELGLCYTKGGEENLQCYVDASSVAKEIGALLQGM